MKTIETENIINYFDNKVKIDVIKNYTDTRGWVSELWRIDDDVYQDGKFDPKMCYFSYTNPLVMRGPHEHKEQCDWFLTICSSMVYIFSDGEKFEYFMTEPNKVYRIKVEPEIIHSYINTSYSNIAVTANFPSSLYKGVNKAEEVDEIRHEHAITPSKNIYVLGASGRLGKSVVAKLYKDMHKYNYHVIPVTQKFEKIEDITTFINNIKATKSKIPNYIINCIGKTNVQNNDESLFDFSNYLVPKHLIELCIHNSIYLLHFSTDYVYQQGKIVNYTKSKKELETWFDQILVFPDINVIANAEKYIKIIRLANLFSQDKNDTHNAINKLYNAYKNNKISIPKNLKIMLTDVDDISEFISKKFIHDFNFYSTITNVSGIPYTIEMILTEFFKINDANIHYIDTPDVVNNPQLFYTRKFIKLDCNDNILKKVNSISHE
jgi:dTDP-4-dehydrorhamnose 3,5-epimerase